MKGTAILSLKPWAKIHAPLPRTPRESQQLLNALTSSFRRQLDHEYPVSQSSSPAAAADANGGEPQATPRNPDSSAHATDNHLRTILDNPLFRVVPSKADVRRGQPGPPRLKDQRLAKEPMVVFDELVASGSVTSADLYTCLQSQLLLASSHTGPGFAKALKESKAGSKVVAWWLASDSEARKLLFRSRRSTTCLLKFMVAEGLQDTVFLWLKMMTKQDVGGHSGRIPEGVAQKLFYHLLVDLVTAETHYGRGLDTAFRHYIWACKAYPSTSYGLAQSEVSVLRSSGAHLHDLMMQVVPSQANQVLPATYEEFAAIFSTLAPNPLLSAKVSLHHPAQPDPLPFVAYVVGLPADALRSWPEAQRDNLMRCGFDALRILLDRDQIKTASDLARAMQRLVPAKAPTSAQGSKTALHTTAEEEHLLARLDLALA